MNKLDDDISYALEDLKNQLHEVSVESSSAGFKIRRVPEHLHTENVKAYEPQIITIGPLNHDLLGMKTHLAEMQKHKVLYLNKLLQQRGEDLSHLILRTGEDLSNLERYVVIMRELEKRARCCYAEPIGMYSSLFVAMLLLDACFIVELFRKFKAERWDDDDYVFRTSWVRKKLGCDLLLADNQLPLFVLQKFYDITKMPEDQETNFQDLILGFFSKVLPVQLLKVSKIGQSSDLDPNIKHLLGFIHNNVPRIIRPARAENWNFIISATNLKEAGITFEKIEGDSLLSIDFDKDAGILKIPTLTIDDDTESFFRYLCL